METKLIHEVRAVKSEGNFIKDELKEPFKEFGEESESLLNSLRQNIESEKYDFIIGVDSSGRLPTLLVSKVVSKVYKSKKPKTLFISGEREAWGGERYSDDLNKRLKYLPTGSSVIIVDDSIHRGDSVLPIINHLKNAGIKVDLAVLSIKDDKLFDDVKMEWVYKKSEHLKELKEKLGLDPYYGVYGGISSVYGLSDWSGVRKSSNQELITPNEEGNLPSIATSKRDNNARNVSDARNAVEFITNKVLNDWAVKSN
jgi:adenine/guanine phosphoribosyltransferase-like PRPP-binding protein